MDAQMLNLENSYGANECAVSTTKSPSLFYTLTNLT